MSTCRKSHARIPDAWDVRNWRQVGDVRRGAGPSPALARVRNWRQVGDVRRGAGPSPALARIRRIVPSPARWPGPGSSPWILRYPQRGFCRARCRTRSRISGETAGRPALLGQAHVRLTRRRCQPGGDHAGPADQAGAGGLRALRPGAVAADSPAGRPVLRRGRQAGALHGAAEDEHHRQLLCLPGAAVRRGDRPPLRGSRPTRSTVTATVVASGCACRRRSGRPASSPAGGGARWTRPVSR